MKEKLHRTISVTAAIVVMLIGISVIIGWIIHNDTLRYIINIPGAVKMKFNVALGFIFSSVAVLLYHFAVENKKSYYISIGLWTLIFFIGLLSLSEYIFGINFGIDELFVKDELPTTKIYYAGRMSPLSAINFILIGVGLFLLNRKRASLFQFIYLSAIAFISVVMLIGINFITDIPNFIRLAIHVSIGFLALAISIYYANPSLPNQINFQQKLATFFIAAILLIGIISVLSTFYINKLNKSFKLVENTNDVLREADQILSLVKDIESGGRGYIITGDSAYLDYFITGKNNIYSHLGHIKELTGDNVLQRTRIDSLSAFVDRRIGFSTQLIQARKEKGFEAAYKLMMTRKGILLTNKIRSLTAAIQLEENSLLLQRQKANSKGTTDFNEAYYILLASVDVLLLTVFFIVRHQLAARVKAEKEAKENEEQIQTMFKAAPDAVIVIDSAGIIRRWNIKAETLFGWKEEEVTGKLLSETIIPYRYREAHQKGMAHFLSTGEGPVLDRSIEIQALQKNDTEFNIALSISPMILKSKYLFIGFIRDITERKKAENEIKQLNADLEKNLHQLETANKELEAFSYSVSHDLRAPLRAVNGYAKMLSEDYKSIFDEEAERLLKVIQDNANKMGKLIDDLLAFSKMGRTDIRKTLVDMKEIAENVSFDLGRTAEHRAAIKIENLHPAHADYSLMQHVFINLISNAIKYSSKSANPLIEIKSQIKNGEEIYSVHDNGVGFDMQYVHKLFGVFQRLHDMHEFEGTGVGLAIVQRIIHKHGGKVWADAKPGEGATFFFSLPRENDKNQTV